MQSRYLFDFVTLKQYGSKFKLTYFKYPVKNSGDEGRKIRSDTHYSEKLDNSLARSKSTVFELSMCNPWKYFVTLTLDQTKYDRYDLPKFRKDLSQFIRNYNRIHGCKIKYLLIPEQHKNGAWHMHGLFDGLPDSALSVNQNGYKDFQAYSSRFGFCSIDEVRDPEKVSSYITKYISKDLSERKADLNAHLYYASKGLNRAEMIFKGSVRSADSIDWDFENDYVKIKWGHTGDFSDVNFD